MQLQRQTITLPIGPVSVRTSLGSQPGAPLLFVHGILVNGSLWDLVLPGLAEVRQVIVPDLPLGGHTMVAQDRTRLHPEGIADTLAALLDSLSVDRVVVVGSDTGGAIAQVFAARHMARVESIILASCDAFSHFPPTILKPFKPMAAIPGFTGLLRRLYRVPTIRHSWMGSGLAAIEKRHPILEACFEQGISTPGAYEDMARFLRRCRPSLTNEAARALESFTGRALIAWSRNAPLFPDADGERLAATIPHAELRWIEQSRAFSMIDQPDALNAAVLAFLANNA